VLCLLYLVTELVYSGGRLGLPLDDSWIHLQFARNLAGGLGLSYNPGELVSGTTAPLWTGILSLLFYLPGNPLLWVKIAGIALHLAGVEATRRLALELGLAPGWSALAAALTAATSWLLWSSISAMEVPLFVFLSVAGMVLHIRERQDPARAPLSLGVFGMAILARPEGLLLIALAIFDRLVIPVRREDGGLELQRPSVRPVLWGGLAAAVIVAPMALLNLLPRAASLDVGRPGRLSGSGGEGGPRKERRTFAGVVACSAAAGLLDDGRPVQPRPGGKLRALLLPSLSGVTGTRPSRYRKGG
jgi:hypothetical protein